MIQKTFELPTMLRAASVIPTTINEKSRTVEVVFSTGAKVLRGGFFTEPYWEELSMDPQSVRLDRLNAGASLLNNHNSESLTDVIGVVENARIENGQGVATVRFSERADVSPIFHDVKTGIIRNISVGYQVFEYEEVDPAIDPTAGRGAGDKKEKEKYRTFRAIDWEPMEISLVGVPADAGAQVRQDVQTTHECRVNLNEEMESESMKTKKTRQIAAQATASVSEETATATETPVTVEGETAEAEDEAVIDEKKTETPTAEVVETIEEKIETIETPVVEAASANVEKTRVLEILKIVDETKLNRSFAKDWIESDATIEKVRALAIEELKKLDEKVHTRNITVTQGETMLTEKRLIAAENALCHRLDGVRYKLTDEGREFRNMTGLEMAKDFLEAGGVSTRNMSKMDLATRALHDSSDFPLLLANVANKFLKDAYQAAPQTFAPFTRMVTTGDFKELSRVQLGNAPALVEVLENGEYTRGTISEASEKYALKTYGKIMGLTRKALLNDDLSAMSRIPQLFGRRARDLESNLVWGLITGNQVMGDGVALFHANHGNLSGSSDAISVTSIGAGRTGMRKQVDLDGELINVMPEYIVVPAAKETLADQFVSTITPAQGSEVNPFANRLRVVAEPRLDASSGVSWYLFGSAAQGDMIELCHLAGEQGPVIETRVGFDVDGMEIKARLDVAAHVMDWRFMWKNPGA